MKWFTIFLLAHILSLGTYSAHALQTDDYGGLDWDFNVVAAEAKAGQIPRPETTRGDSYNFSLQISCSQGFSGTIAFHIGEQPDGIMIHIPTPLMIANATFARTTLRVETFASTPIGIYEFNLTATDGTESLLRLIRLEVVETFFGAINIRVVDTSGNPVPDAYVMAYYQCCRYTQAPDEPFGAGVTDENGAVSFPDLLEGKYAVGVVADGYYEGGAHINVTSGRTTDKVMTVKLRPPWIYESLHLFVVGGVAAAITAGTLYFGWRKRKTVPQPEKVVASP